MEIFLEQFIPSDKNNQSLKKIKIIVIATILAGVVLFFMISPVLAFILQISAVGFFFISYFSFVDYEYELFNGNIDISRIYAGSMRRIAEKINKEDVERVCESSEIINRKQALFNKNIKGLNIYTFQLKGGKKVQLALNSELENVVKVIYKGRVQVK